MKVISGQDDTFPLPNTAEHETCALIGAEGFREYDARWRYPERLNLEGARRVGMALGTLLREQGVRRAIVGHDYRAYAAAVKMALGMGMMRAGTEVVDIGLAITPMAYFAQSHYDAPGLAMVTASHNPNGWTGVKMGAAPPQTFGEAEMAALRALALTASSEAMTQAGGTFVQLDDVREAYLADLTDRAPFARPLRVVVSCSNGTAGHFAPAALRRLGAEVIALTCDLDWTFPNSEPNTESLAMLRPLGAAVREAKAELGIALDGDGDRCGVVDAQGVPVFADTIGLFLARRLARSHSGARFVVDVKSTGGFKDDADLLETGAQTLYWRTGHSHMKRKAREIGALAAFEKSGHYIFAPPMGRGYDDGVRAAIEVCDFVLEDGGLAHAMARTKRRWISPTLSAACEESRKYAIAQAFAVRAKAMRDSGELFAGHKIVDVLEPSGARVELANGAWALARASSNQATLVVVVETPESEQAMRDLFAFTDALLRQEPDIGSYDQTLDG